MPQPRFQKTFLSFIAPSMMSHTSTCKIRRRILKATIGLSVFSLSTFAIAETAFPSRPIRLIVPYAAGGGTDIMARLAAQSMSQELGQPVIVENRAGAAGSLGAGQVARSTPDGYTILMGTASTHAINPAIYATLPYDPVSDFKPISTIASIPGVVIVHGNSPYRTLQELVSAMHETPNRLTYGTQGQGGLGHLMGEMLNTIASVRSIHVPYRGAAPAIQDLLAKNIDVVYDTLPAVLPHLQSGALRALAVTAPTRSLIVPDVPTTAEAGYPDFQAQTWNALFVPAGVPDAVAARLTQAAVTAVQEPETNQRIVELSATPIASTAASLAAMQKEDAKRWSQVAQTSKISLN